MKSEKKMTPVTKVQKDYFIAKAPNKKGRWFALSWKYKEVVGDDNVIYQTEEKVFTVWKQCENYDGKVAGGLRKTWRYIAKDMTVDEADKLFAKKVTK